MQKNLLNDEYCLGKGVDNCWSLSFVDIPQRIPLPRFLVHNGFPVLCDLVVFVCGSLLRWCFFPHDGVEHCWSLSSIDVPQEFEVHFKKVFRIYDLEEMVIRMADRTWTVAFDNLRLDA
ncbi:hypothetical protein RHMOL_Rhmol11G0073300 [Rhododendron molle]|uniref:Uncharacterized protein n=1 Tax=Rhododendron molle TaxID=49168 RepID=A0ACC0LQP4_RHOML|nr:hypothetical protein RHMOL_Rhmol11G0073300 [Rhododendron molle]